MSVVRLTEVVLVRQKKAVAIAVRNVSGRRRWSKLAKWLSADVSKRYVSVHDVGVTVPPCFTCGFAPQKRMVRQLKERPSAACVAEAAAKTQCFDFDRA